jgi:hypothetical protein
MNVLTLLQDTCRELKLPVPSSVASSSDREIQLLIGLLQLEGAELRSKYIWPVLRKEFLFNTQVNVASYGLPEDFDFEYFQTHWDRTTRWDLRGPLSPQEWQRRKSGITTVLPRFGFRVMGGSSLPLYLEPTPTEAHELVFEYQSVNWLAPAADWVASTAFTAGSYCKYLGNVYQTTLGGTTGATPPTHDQGSASDGGVTWTLASYERVVSDTDVLVLPPQVLKLGMKWRWKRENGLEYDTYQAEAVNAAERAVQSGRSAQEVQLTASHGSALINYWSIPDGRYG